MKLKITIFILVTHLFSAQVKGIVIDSVSGKPIPLVNIWVQNESIGATSEENGEFIVNTNSNKTLIFSALGYEKATVTVSNPFVVKLKPVEYELDEIVILNRQLKKQLEIGKIESPIYMAFDNGPKISVKYFPYLPKYTKTKYIKKVSIQTDSKINNATFRLHFYNVDQNGFPGEELFKKDFIVSVNEGVLKTSFNLLDYNLVMPKNGLFIGFEKLQIQKNKVEKEIKNFNDNTTKIQTTFYPLILYNYSQRDNQFIFVGGKWELNSKQNSDGTTQKISVFEPVINLILTD